MIKVRDDHPNNRTMTAQPDDQTQISREKKNAEEMTMTDTQPGDREIEAATKKILTHWRDRFPNNRYAWPGAAESFAFEAAKVVFAALPSPDVSGEVLGAGASDILAALKAVLPFTQFMGEMDTSERELAQKAARAAIAKAEALSAAPSPPAQGQIEWTRDKNHPVVKALKVLWDRHDWNSRDYDDDPAVKLLKQLTDCDLPAAQGQGQPPRDVSLREWVDKYPGDPEALCDALIEECERLKHAALSRDVSEVVGALKPFAEIADLYDDREDDRFEIWKDCHDEKTRVTLGQCRQARAALSRAQFPAARSAAPSPPAQGQGQPPRDVSEVVGALRELAKFSSLPKDHPLIARVEAALASAPPAQGGEWQSMACAPHDGTLIETKYLSDDPKKVRWMISADKGTGWYVNGYDGARLTYEPTHWRYVTAQGEPGEATARRRLDEIRHALFPPEVQREDKTLVDHSADENLEAAIISLEHHNADKVSIGTLNKVLSRLVATRAILDASPPLVAEQQPGEKP